MSTPTSGDLLLVSRDGVNYQIDYDDMSTLQDTDLLLVSRGGVNYQVEAQYVATGNGVILPEVEVLTPLDKAGDPDLTYLKTDTIAAVNLSSGTLTYATDGVSSVDATNPTAVVLSFPTSKDFEYFPVGYYYAQTETWNRTAQWSSLWNFIGTTSANEDNVFDSNPATLSVFDSGGSVELDVSGLGLTGDVVITHYRDYYFDTNAITITVYGTNGETATVSESQIVSSGTLVQCPAASVSGTIDKIVIERDYRLQLKLNKIVIDGKELVDASITDPLAVQVVSQDTVNSQMVMSGGTWNTGDIISRTVDYDNILTLSGDTSLSSMSPGSAVMTDGVLGGTGYSQTPYTLTTTDIDSVSNAPDTSFLQDFATPMANLPDERDVALMFDGDDDTYGQVNGGVFPGVAEWQVRFNVPIPILAGQTLEIKLNMYAGQVYQTGRHYMKFVGTGETGLYQTTTAPPSDFNQADGANSGPKIRTFTATENTALIGIDFGVVSSDLSTPIASLYYIKVDGQPLLQNNNLQLTFPGDVNTNPDLRYFQVDDLVQGFEQEDWANTGTSSGWAPSVPIANAFDGSVSTEAYPNPGVTGSYTFATPVPYRSKVEILSMASVQQDPNFKVNGQMVPLVPSEGKIWKDVTSILDATGGTFQSFSTSYNPDNWLTYIWAIRVDDIILQNGGTSTAAKVISTDLAANTMVVDGGEWDSSNQSQVWSAGLTSSTGSFLSGQPANLLFNGDLSNYANPSSGSGSSLTFTPPSTLSYTSKVEIYAHGAGTHSFNGGTAASHSDFTWTTIASGSGTISSITVTGSNYPAWSAIRVDNKLLVDAINNSETWSNYSTITEGNTGSLFNDDASLAFDGDLSTFTTIYSGKPDQPYDVTTLVFTFPSPITVNTGIRVKLENANAPQIFVNGTELNSSATVGWNDVSFTGVMNTLTIGPAGAGFSINLNAIEVDGLLLVDTGLRDLGDKNVQFATPGGTGDIVSINTSNNTMFLSNSNDRWIANNKAGTAFSVAAGSINNPPAPDYLNIAFTSMNAGTTPFSGVNATLSSRTWTLETAPDKTGPWTLVDNYEEFDMTASQDGATPWTTGKPVLVQSTWYRVKVTYNSTAADSVESVYHTFKTAV